MIVIVLAYGLSFAGFIDGRVSYGASGVVAPDGTILCAARPFEENLLVAELDVAPQERRQTRDR